MVLIVWNVDLIRQEAHGFDDSSGDTFNNKGVNVGNVISPDYTLLSGLIWSKVSFKALWISLPWFLMSSSLGIIKES